MKLPATVAAVLTAGFVITLSIPAFSAPEAAAASAAHARLSPEAETGHTIISSEGPVSFDANQGVCEFKKNVSVRSSHFDLTGAHVVKVVFAGASDRPLKSPNAVRPILRNVHSPFGDVNRITATGILHLQQRDTENGENSIEAGGGRLLYEPEIGGLILSNGSPWVKQGPIVMRALTPNLNLHIKQSGTVVAVGKWESVISSDPSALITPDTKP